MDEIDRIDKSDSKKSAEDALVENDDVNPFDLVDNSIFDFDKDVFKFEDIHVPW